MMKKLRLLICIVALLTSATPMLQAQVAINTDGGNPHNSAMLDIESNSKGLLIPRLSTTQRNALTGTAVNGLMVYDVTLNKFFYFKGGAWAEGSLGGLWSKNGSNTYLTNTGDEVGIGTTSPGFLFDVQATSNAYINVKATSTGTSFGGILLDRPNTSSKMRLLFRTATSNKWGVGLFDANDNFAISRSTDIDDGTFHINRSTGNVGIGTTSPYRPLEVAGSARALRLTSSTQYSVVEFISSHATDWAIGTGAGTLQLQSSTNNFASTTYQYKFSTSYFYPNSNNTKALGGTSNRWTNLYSYDGNFADDVTISDDLWVSGNVGIGTVTPSVKLEVTNATGETEIRISRPSTTYASLLNFYNGASSEWVIVAASGSSNMVFSRGIGNTTGNLGLMTTGGNVGIGTQSPEASLHIQKNVTETEAIFGANIGYPNAVDVCLGNLTGNSFLYVGQASGYKGFLMWDHNSTASDALFRIGTYAGNNDLTLQHAGGNVGIGIGSPDAKLDVNGTTKLGESGTVFSEIREFTGTTHSTTNYVIVSLPSGYNETNTRVISVEINYLNDRWVGLGRKYGQTDLYDNIVSYQTNGTNLYIYYPDYSSYKNRAFRVMLLKI